MARNKQIAPRTTQMDRVDRMGLYSNVMVLSKPLIADADYPAAITIVINQCAM